MSKYGQYCPVARSLDILGDRWTLLIIRDMLAGTTHFNDLERGLPGISRGLLARRLKLLQQAGMIEKQVDDRERRTTSYRLTQAGSELIGVILALRSWGETWAFGDPTPEELDPVLLMWRLRQEVQVSSLPETRTVVQFDFPRPIAASFWLVLTAQDVTLCLTDPGYEINVLARGDLAAFYKIWGGRLSYHDAISHQAVTVEGTPSLIRAFPDWFGWGVATH